MFLTLKLKLRKPSQKKSLALDNLLNSYNSLYSELLTSVLDNLDHYRERSKCRVIDKETGEVKREKISEKTLRKALPAIKELEADMPALYKESALKDIAGGVCSFFALEEGDAQEVGLPMLPDPSGNHRHEALLEIGNCGTDLEREQYWVAQLLKGKPGKFRPVLIIRARDMGLLVKDEQLYLFLKVYNDKQGQPVKNGFFDLAQKKDFSYGGKAGALFPLELGKNGWQWKKFIEPLILDEVDLKSARLVKNGDYFLELSIEFPEAERVKPETYLGIDLGENVSTAYSLVDKDGLVLERGHVSDELRQIRIEAGKKVQDLQRRGKRVKRKHYKQKAIDGAIHIIINRLLDLAAKHKSQIVLEDLDSNFRVRGKFTKSCYKKIAKFIGYKAKMRGISVRTVWPAYTSKICISCGSLNTVRSKDRLSIECLDCEHKDHADEAASVNIARRALYRKADWKGGWKEFHQSFANDGDSGTILDLRQEQAEMLELAA